MRDVEVEKQNVSDAEGVVEELLRDTDVVDLVKLGRAGSLQKECAFREVLCAVLPVGMNLNFKLTNDKTAFWKTKR